MQDIMLNEAFVVLSVLCSLNQLWKPGSHITLGSPELTLLILTKKCQGNPSWGHCYRNPVLQGWRLSFDGPSPIALTQYLPPGRGEGRGWKVWGSCLQVFRHSMAKSWRSHTSSKDIIFLWNYPHCMVKMSKVGATRERLLWCSRKLWAEQKWLLIKPTTVLRPIPFYVKKNKKERNMSVYSFSAPSSIFKWSIFITGPTDHHLCCINSNCIIA